MKYPQESSNKIVGNLKFQPKSLQNSVRFLFRKIRCGENFRWKRRRFECKMYLNQNGTSSCTWYWYVLGDFFDSSILLIEMQKGRVCINNKHLQIVAINQSII